MSIHKRIAIGIITAGTVCFLAWCAGFDFNHRGDAAFCVAFLSLASSIMAATYPGGVK